MSPEVSVVMSVYNGERYLREAVESMLGQTFADFEFIIVDDGSTDNSWEILTNYTDPRIRLVRNEENIGLTRSLNKGLALARGEYIARMDADDRSIPGRLEKQVAYMEEHPEVGLLGAAYEVREPQGNVIAVHRQPSSDTAIRWQMLFHNAFCNPSVIFRRRLISHRENGYNESLPYSQDYELWGRLLRATRGANLQEPLVAFRQHKDSIQATHREEQQRIASQIAREQIEVVCPRFSLTLTEIEMLRRRYTNIPQRLTNDDMILYVTFMKLLDEFAKQPHLDIDVVRYMRKQWVNDILASVSADQLRDLWTSGLMGALLRADPGLVLAHSSSYLKHRMKRLLKVR